MVNTLKGMDYRLQYTVNMKQT